MASATFKQIAVLNESLKRLKFEVQQTIEKNENLSIQYDKERAEFKKKKLAIERQACVIEYKIDNVQKAIEDFEKKIDSEREDVVRFDKFVRENNFELDDTNANIAAEKNAFLSTTQKLKLDIEKEKEELRSEKNWGMEMELQFEQAIRQGKEETEDKLKALRKSQNQAYARAEKKFKLKQEPLLQRCKFLDSEAYRLENEIFSKSKEIEQMRRKYDNLLKKYSKIGQHGEYLCMPT